MANDRNHKESQSSCISQSSARSSVFNAANQSLSQQELTDIMFASVRNPGKLSEYQDGQDGDNNIGILTAMA